MPQAQTKYHKHHQQRRRKKYNNDDENKKETDLIFNPERKAKATAGHRRPKAGHNKREEPAIQTGKTYDKPNLKRFKNQPAILKRPTPFIKTRQPNQLLQGNRFNPRTLLTSLDKQMNLGQTITFTG